jgi:hypothetical protein
MKMPNAFLNHTALNPLTRAVLIAIACYTSTTLADNDRKTELPVVESVLRIDPVLERLAAQQASLPVIIVFGEQPQRKIARALNQRYEPNIDTLAARVRGIYDKYLPKETLESKASETEKSRLLSQYITDADKTEIRTLNEQRDKLTSELRHQIGLESAAAVADVQKLYIDRITHLGAKVQERYVTLNAVSAEIPASALKEIASLDGVAEVFYNAWVAARNQT